MEEEAQQEVVGSRSILSSFTSTCCLQQIHTASIASFISTCSSAISTILRSGSDLIITGGSSFGVAMARETVGEEEEEVEGKEKTVVGMPGCPRGVRMIVFVPGVEEKVLRQECWGGRAVGEMQE